jgi:hypothetical protein
MVCLTVALAQSGSLIVDAKIDVVADDQVLQILCVIWIHSPYYGV